MSTRSTFEKNWLKRFAADVPKQALQQHVTAHGCFIWHIFSWKLKPNGSYLVGNAARKTFDAEDKTGAQYFQPFGAPHELQLTSPTAAELDGLNECYAVSADKTWTYIKTHEGDLCGPYFCKLPCTKRAD